MSTINQSNRDDLHEQQYLSEWLSELPWVMWRVLGSDLCSWHQRDRWDAKTTVAESMDAYEWQEQRWTVHDQFWHFQISVTYRVKYEKYCLFTVTGQRLDSHVANDEGICSLESTLGKASLLLVSFAGERRVNHREQNDRASERHYFDGEGWNDSTIYLEESESREVIHFSRQLLVVDWKTSKRWFINSFGVTVRLISVNTLSVKCKRRTMKKG